MGRRSLALLVALAPLATACVTPPDAPTVLASARGTGANDAYAISSAAQKSGILRLLGVQSQSQMRRVIDGRAFDVLTVRDTATGATREVWFDISRYFRRGY